MPRDDLEYAVDDASGRERIFASFDEAASFAVAISASTDRPVNIDTLCWTRAAAVAAGLEDEYDDDPDASVTQRITITAAHIGRVA